MVAPVENLTALRIRVAAIGPHPRLPDWDLAAVDVLSAAPVPGLSDLLSSRVGQRIDLAVPAKQADGLHPGIVADLRARLAVGEVLAERDPAEGDFTIENP
ncbi:MULTISPECIES: hypothetical protein [Kitasatospora]|uniref:Uncharacterized protein n=2 Tax=Kitasatospora TaxID=2063 RepID=A0ABT1J1G9_9ACTN|nr:hypothetical protein [Kitasatospora paracochleata]MCP2311274.1 hypothetical protein [Kitasatospora paracochleata]